MFPSNKYLALFMHSVIYFKFIILNFVYRCDNDDCFVMFHEVRKCSETWSNKDDKDNVRMLRNT